MTEEEKTDVVKGEVIAPSTEANAEEAKPAVEKDKDSDKNWKEIRAVLQELQHENKELRDQLKAKKTTAKQEEEDVLPVLEAYIKGQRICNVYVDGKEQVSVMSQKMMHHLGLEVQGKFEFKATMENNVSVKCVGVCKGIRITVCGIKVATDM